MHEPTIGPLLRAYRKDAHASQGQLAAWLSDRAGRPVTRNEVSRWEGESRLPTPFWQKHLAAALDADADALRRAVDRAKTKRRLLQCENHQPEGGDVQRRAFLGAMAGLAASASWPVLPQPKPGQRLGSSDIQRLLNETARLRRLDNYFGGADTYKLYATVLKETQDLVRNASFSSETERNCKAVIAERAQLAGWAAFDAGLHAEATEHYEISFEAAKEAGHPALAGNALAFLAYQKVTFKKPSVAMAVASYETAKQHATPRVRALLLERMAWTHAVAGQPNEAERALAAAAETVHLASDRPEPDWVFWVNEDEIKIMTGRCWTQLRRPLRAVPILEDVLGRFDDTHARDKAIYLTSLAHAYLDAGEIEQSASITQQAIDLAAGVGSVRPIERITKVTSRLRPHRSLTAVSGVLDAAKALPTAR
ncbi:helix-turn-helix domain-containing protein [Lentzea sp. NEAU-D7]|uniref:helix-turn-helix domain-containing protein n=1 Tax=Lentzea sp. NEAU-D7 TaxID=2994667 RepID=UPI00224B2BC8|nr:helix-turn-helix domain-containing protein [Lentzea sp. NEAU-D7]MCX2950871.1 helix-turn-helix domain-containing protein [Lentzea sp. NEAU-D7]